MVIKKRNKMINILGFMAFLANGDNYAVAPLLINISNDLNLEISSAALSVTAYMLSFGLFTIIFGPLGDRFGKTKIISIAAFGTAIFSMLGAIAFNLPSLILLRAMNGAFGAGIFPVTLALVGEVVEPENRQKFIGKVMGMMFLGAASATAIGGALAYFGSWRMVYLGYGLAELILAFIMIRILPNTPSVIDHLNFTSVYKEALSNKKLMARVTTIMIVGYCVFGSFTYSGKLIQAKTGYSVLIVGIILTIFGAGTVFGGRMAPKVRVKIGKWFFILTGILGSISLGILSHSVSIALICIGLFGFGLSFVFLQSTMIMKVQEALPKLRGTAMSLASFNIFVGGAIGTIINGKVLDNYGVSNIFIISSIIMLVVGFIASIATKERV